MLGQIAELSMHLKNRCEHSPSVQVWLQESPAVRPRVSAKVNNGNFVQMVESSHLFHCIWHLQGKVIVKINKQQCTGILRVQCIYPEHINKKRCISVLSATHLVLFAATYRGHMCSSYVPSPKLCFLFSMTSSVCNPLSQKVKGNAMFQQATFVVMRA